MHRPPSHSSHPCPRHRRLGGSVAAQPTRTTPEDPARRPPGARAPASWGGEEAAESAEGYRTHVLLAEDDQDMRELLSLELRRAGYIVEEVSDGADLMERVAGTESDGGATGEPLPVPDMIISDIRMPGWSGMDVLATLRQADWSMPVILITAFGDPQTHARAERLGAVALLDKPFRADRLLELARAVLPPQF